MTIVTSTKSNFPRANREITAKNVRLIDDQGTMLGVLSLQEALHQAEERGLDLVEISPQADPPVCKILDFGKYKYEAQRKANEARKKQKVIELKELRLRPNIGQNDYEVKLKSAARFIADGNKVKITLRFRGREIAHHEIGLKLLQRMQQDLEEVAKIELAPKIDGKQLLMVISPK